MCTRCQELRLLFAGHNAGTTLLANLCHVSSHSIGISHPASSQTGFLNHCLPWPVFVPYWLSRMSCCANLWQLCTLCHLVSPKVYPGLFLSTFFSCSSMVVNHFFEHYFAAWYYGGTREVLEVWRCSNSVCSSNCSIHAYWSLLIFNWLIINCLPGLMGG